MSDSKSPSRRRYEQNNPTVSIRISRETKDQLDELVDDLEKTKKSWFEELIEEERGRFRAVFKQGFTKGKDQGVEEGYEEGYREGRRAGYQEFVATVPCVNCGEPVPINTNERKARLFEAIERVNQDWSALPPPGELTCDISHEECPSES